MKHWREQLWSQLRANPKRSGMIALLAGLLLATLYWNLDFCSGIWPGNATIKKELSRLKESQERLRKTIVQSRAQERRLQKFVAANNCYWLKSRDGNPEIDLRARIEKAARSAGLDLKAVGNLRTNKITDGVQGYEISISADADIKVLADFLAAVYQGTPRLYWDNLNLRPDNLQSPKLVMLNGTLKTIVVETPELVKLLSGNKS